MEKEMLIENLRRELEKIGVRKDPEDLEELAKELNGKLVVTKELYDYIEVWLDREEDPEIAGELVIRRQYLSTEEQIIERCLELIEEIQKL